MPEEAEALAPPEGIDIPLPEVEPPDDALELKADDPEITISLRYWHSNSQCLSDWQAKELKKLAKIIGKAQELTAIQLKSDQSLGWKLHSGPAKGHGFSRPTKLSKDIKLSELRVDNKARIHGALIDDTFFLVWLDRGHEVFPQKK